MYGLTHLKSKSDQPLPAIEGRALESKSTHSTWFNGPELYPTMTINAEAYTVFMEGVIYNETDQGIEEKLHAIAGAVSNQNQDIVKFQNEQKGEYLIIIEYGHKTVVFNDYFGRLCTYVVNNDKYLAFTRILDNARKLTNGTIDPIGVADLITFGFALSDHTFFEEIKYMGCGEIIQVAHDQLSKTNLSIDCSLKNPYPNIEAAAVDLATNLKRVTAECVTKTQEKERKIIADITAGFDSRTVFGCLQPLTSDVTYISNDVLGDESAMSEDLFKLYNTGSFERIPYSDAPLTDVNSLALQMDGKGTYDSNRICIHALDQVSQNHDYSSFRFGGIGFTDFLRKGFRDDATPLLDSIIGNFKYGTSATIATQITGLDLEKYKAHLKEIFDTWPEKDPSAQHRKLHLLQMIVKQSRLPEDRERLNFWIVQPLWDHQICMDSLSKIPSHWRGNFLHTQLLLAIDPKLINVPVNKSYIDFSNLNKIKSLDKKENSALYMKVRSFLKPNPTPPRTTAAFKSKSLSHANGEQFQLSGDAISSAEFVDAYLTAINA